MIIGKDFACGHIGKTGGDALVTLFAAVPDLVLHADAISDSRKHDTFQARGLVGTNRMLILSIRRLPCWVISMVNQIKSLGPRFRIPTSEIYSRSQLADEFIRTYTNNGSIPIHTWLRMEYLRDDLIAFLDRSVRKLSAAEKASIQTIQTNPARDYDHNVFEWFTRREVARLYRLNPRWAAIEALAYGGLLTRGNWTNPVVSACRQWPQGARTIILDALIHTGQRKMLRDARREFRHALRVAARPAAS